MGDFRFRGFYAFIDFNMQNRTGRQTDERTDGPIHRLQQGHVIAIKSICVCVCVFGFADMLQTDMTVFINVICKFVALQH